MVFHNLGIKHVVNCCKERNVFEGKEGFQYHNVAIVDHPNEDISKYFADVVEFIGTHQAVTLKQLRAVPLAHNATLILDHNQSKLSSRSKRCWCTVMQA